MPQGALGQLITFAVDLDPDEKFAKYIFIHAQKNDTIAKIAARRGHPNLAQTILSLNKAKHTLEGAGIGSAVGARLRTVHQKLPEGLKIKLPGILTQGESISITAGDPPPIITDGYATYDVVNVPGRRGINRFDGFNPVAMDVAVQWNSYPDIDTPGAGQLIESQITTLQRFAGIGTSGAGGGLGARIGPPAVIRVSVTDNYGAVVPLIPAPFQWTPSSSAPLYRISNLAWGQNPVRTSNQGKVPGGMRVVEACTITLTEFTPTNLVDRSASTRSVKRNAKNTKHAAGIVGGTKAA